MDSISRYFQDNPALTSVLGLWSAALLTIVSKEIPDSIYRWIKRQIIVQIQIPCTEDDFFRIVNWLESKGYSTGTRAIRITRSKVTAGVGIHYFIHEGRLFVMTRRKEDNKLSYRIREEIEIQTFGRSQAPLRRLIEAIRHFENGETTIISHWISEAWVRLNAQPIRRLNTVFIPDENKQLIHDSMKRFLEARSWYLMHGIPYRTGYCFYGPPGTGKTTLARAICGEFNLRLYILNLSSFTDATFSEALANVEPGSVVLIEDIDCFHESWVRDSANSGQIYKPSKDSLTLSGLLNGIDGATCSDGTVFIYTTNRLEMIDPALLRPGRVDHVLYVGAHTPETFAQAMAAYYPGFAVPEEVALGAGLTPAQLQQQVMVHRGDPQAVLQALRNARETRAKSSDFWH